MNCQKAVVFSNAIKSRIQFLALWALCFTGVVHGEGFGIGTVFSAVSTIQGLYGGTSTVASQMVVFDKTYTRKCLGVVLIDRYLMNVFSNGRVAYKHSYTNKSPEKSFVVVSTNTWEYNYGRLEMGDHQIEIRDYACKQGGDFSGIDIELKVSFTMGVRWQTDKASVLPSWASVSIDGWDELPADCSGYPNPNVGSLITWDNRILPNGETQVYVNPTMPSFKLNRSYGSTGTMAVTCN